MSLRRQWIKPGLCGGALFCLMVSVGCKTATETSRPPISQPDFVRVGKQPPPGTPVTGIITPNSPAMDRVQQASNGPSVSFIGQQPSNVQPVGQPNNVQPVVMNNPVVDQRPMMQAQPPSNSQTQALEGNVIPINGQNYIVHNGQLFALGSQQVAQVQPANPNVMVSQPPIAQPLPAGNQQNLMIPANQIGAAQPQQFNSQQVPTVPVINQQNQLPIPQIPPAPGMTVPPPGIPALPQGKKVDLFTPGPPPALPALPTDLSKNNLQLPSNLSMPPNGVAQASGSSKPLISPGDSGSSYNSFEPSLSNRNNTLPSVPPTSITIPPNPNVSPAPIYP